MGESAEKDIGQGDSHCLWHPISPSFLRETSGFWPVKDSPVSHFC